MRAVPFWVVAALAVVTWVVAAVLFWAGMELPMPPVRIVAVTALFYVPSLVIGIWAGHPSTALRWSRGRLVLTCLLAPVVFLPFALLTFPLVPLTWGAIVLPVAILAWTWHDQGLRRLGNP